MLHKRSFRTYTSTPTHKHRHTHTIGFHTWTRQIIELKHWESCDPLGQWQSNLCTQKTSALHTMNYYYTEHCHYFSITTIITTINSITGIIRPPSVCSNGTSGPVDFNSEAEWFTQLHKTVKLLDNSTTATCCFLILCLMEMHWETFFLTQWHRVYNCKVTKLTVLLL